MNLINSAKWVAFSQFFKVIVQLVNIVYLARLIPPSEYGIMAMALVVINFGLLIRDLGTAAAIIQRKEIDDGIINSIFWLNLFMGLFIAVAIIFASPLIASFFHTPKLIYVLLLISLIFPISSSSAAHLALLERASKFRVISLIEIFSALIGLISALILAYQGYGVYSLVIQTIVLNVFSTILFWKISKWRPQLSMMFKFSGLKQIVGFSVNLSLFNFVNYFSRNTDSFIIGRFMPSSVLGAYSLAYRVMLFPLQSLTFVVSRSLLPILSHHQNDNAIIRKTYSNCVFSILYLVVPLMSGLAYLSSPFVSVIFGNQWTLTAEILKWLAPTAIIQAVLSSTGTVFIAKGRTDLLLKLGILGTFLYVLSFLIGVNFDIITFSKLYFIANVLNFFPAMILMMRLIEGSLFTLLNKCFVIFFINFGMLAFLYFIDGLDFINAINEQVVYLILMISLGGGFYVLSSVLLIGKLRRFLLARFVN